jgi:exosome complex component CSL4
MSSNTAIPGDKIATIEEFEGGKNTFEDGHNVRSTVIGITVIDKKNRIAQVENLKFSGIPSVNDIVIGTVAAVMSSMIAVSINYVNNIRTKSNVECICQTRNLRKKNVALLNDIVALKIIAHKNGTIHATISEPDLGVLFTKCKKCGGNVIPLRDAIKCTECNWIDERKLSNNFGKSDFIKLGA